MIEPHYLFAESNQSRFHFKGKKTPKRHRQIFEESSPLWSFRSRWDVDEVGEVKEKTWLSQRSSHTSRSLGTILMPPMYWERSHSRRLEQMTFSVLDWGRHRHCVVIPHLSHPCGTVHTKRYGKMPWRSWTQLHLFIFNFWQCAEHSDTWSASGM